MRERIAAALLLLGGCAHPSLLLLPTEDGHRSAVAVIEANGQPSDRVIDREGSMTALRPGSESRAVSPDRVKTRDRDLLGALPPRAGHYTLYFDEGLTQPTPESAGVLDAIRRDIATRPGAEVEVVGHTDTVGSEADNDALSLRRAERICAILVAAGFDPALLSAVGRGEHDLLEPTQDGHPSAANRRADVIVR